MSKSLVLVLTFVCLFVGSIGLTMKIEPKTEECFTENLLAGDDVEVRWGVQDGGLLDIETRVKFQGQIVWSKLYFEGREEGYYKIVPTVPGAYSFCFNNEMSRFTVKTVNFEFIKKGTNNVFDTPAGHAKPEDLNPMQQSIQRISDQLFIIETNNNYYSHRETTHRNTAESTNSRVQWYSFFETFFVLIIAVGQVMYLRRKVNRSNLGKRRV